jgi:lipopolysaccharide export system protein LptC
MSVELHLPDLPEVPISLGPAAQAGAATGHALASALREVLSAYLPLLLMALLALASWWLVKNSPRPLAPPEDTAVSPDPDYTMTQFSLERFDAAGA